MGAQDAGKGAARPRTSLDVVAVPGDVEGGHGPGKDADAGAAAPAPPAAPPAPAPAALRALRAAASFARDQWFILGLGVAIGLAAAAPNLGKSGGWIRSEYSVKIPATVAIFIISGIGLKTKALLGAAAGAWVHVRVQAISLALLPALGAAIASGLRAAGFNRLLADGMVVMAAMPTTVSTNVVFTKRAAGNEAAALVNAVLGNIIGIFITPLWLSLFLDVQGQAPYAKVLVELSYTVIAPLVLGQVLQYTLPKAVEWFKSKVNTADVSSLCILLLVWATFSSTFADPNAKASARDAAAVAGLDVAFLLLAAAASFLVAWPPVGRRGRAALRATRPDAVAVVVCGSTKTVALGVPLISVLFGATDYAGLLATPLVVYHALQILLGGAALPALRRWCLEEPLWLAGVRGAPVAPPAPVPGAAGGGAEA
ncbi:MAG: SBF-like CPA transporter family-domain-containing protein [Monoraphidium minutum]|nr:MAG: SBF-like CPA transporter family-domain-containing protein [Monoraphidium minutum]